MSIKCEKCGRVVEALPIHACTNKGVFGELIIPMAFGLSDKEKRNLRFVWNAALDEAVKVTYNKGTEVNYHGIAEAIKELKDD